MTHAPSLGISRRHLLEIGGLSALAALLTKGPASGDENQQTTLTPASPRNTTFASMKQVNAGVLNIGYAEAGPANGQPVILLHGWPFDIHAFVDVAPLLAQAGYRVIVPFQRGYGSTRSFQPTRSATAQQSICGEDVVNLMDALKIQKAIIGGFDIGSRTAAVVGILWPDRVKALVLVSGYLIANVPANKLAGTAESRIRILVSVVFHDATRAFRLHAVHLRFQQARLDDPVAEMAVQRCDLQSHGGVLQESRSCGDGDTQLPLAHRPRGRRSEIRQLREQALRGSCHRSAHDHDRERFRRRERERRRIPE